MIVVRCRALRLSIWASAMLFALAPFASGADSSWIKVGASGRLIYSTDDTGDRIMDYSTVGYKGGLVPLPTYSSVVTPERIVTVNPVAGDNLANIQNAINKVAGVVVQINGIS